MICYSILVTDDKFTVAIESIRKNQSLPENCSNELMKNDIIIIESIDWHMNGNNSDSS